MEAIKIKSYRFEDDTEKRQSIQTAHDGVRSSLTSNLTDDRNKIRRIIIKTTAVPSTSNLAEFCRPIYTQHMFKSRVPIKRQ